jgi:hypothetical protein
MPLNFFELQLCAWGLWLRPPSQPNLEVASPILAISHWEDFHEARVTVSDSFNLAFFFFVQMLFPSANTPNRRMAAARLGTNGRQQIIRHANAL